MRKPALGVPLSSVVQVLALTFAVVALPGSPVQAETYHVDDDSCPATGSGTPADPFCSIQAGIDAASAGDTVQVAPGTYSENITMKSGVLIQGAGQGNTIIDGGGSGSVVTAVGVDSAAMLDGFTITNGDADDGGGMYNSNSSPTVTNCTFSGNTAYLMINMGRGGGMYNSNSSPTVTNCTFSANDAEERGGGMYNVYSSPTVSNCTFSGNTAHRGGGMYNESSSPTVTGCSFNGNSSTLNLGGGMANDHSSPTVSRCSFFDNDAYNYGGGMANFSGSSPTVAGCIFSKNSTVLSSGGDISNQGPSSLPTVINSTFYTEAVLGYMMFNENSSPTVTNCIFWGFGDPIWNSGTSAPTVTFSVVPYSGTGNIWEDPMFVNAANRDFHLLPSSPCIDAGDNSDPDLPTIDIDGDDRRIDDPTVPDTGNGEPPIVDMGADEYNPSTPIFDDGFETGNCASWSASVGETP